MPRDIGLFSTYYPQAGDSIDQVLKRLLARAVRPFEDAVIYLASAARLGTTTGVIIDTRGARGILFTHYVSAVAGAGTSRIGLYTMNNILSPISETRILQTGYTVTGVGGCSYPGNAGAASSTFLFGSTPLGRYTQMNIVNSSAVPGDEVTSELSYILID